MIDVSIIIVSWNVKDLLIACLESILASPVAINHTNGNQPIIEIIVVDSASNDDTVTTIQRDYPQVQCLAQSDNVGFTQGNNIGLNASQGRYVFLLNPDTEIIADAIPQMMAYLDKHIDVGIVGPHTLNTDGTTQSSRRRFMSKPLAFFESTWWQPVAPKSMIENYYLSNYPDDAILDVDWMQGSALMVRRASYEQVGGLDTAFVMYFEEQDWCKRIKNHGWRAVYLGTAQIIHHGGKSADQIGAQKHIWFQESKLHYSRKHHGMIFAIILRWFLLMNYLIQLAIEGAKAIIGHKRDLRKERVAEYWKIIRSGLKVS